MTHQVRGQVLEATQTRT